MTLPEFASMVEIMRRDQKHNREHPSTQARQKADWCERAVDKAVEQILADVPTGDEPVAHYAK